MAIIGDFEVLVGCDPEFWVKKNGKVISAHGLIPGTKKDPYQVDGGQVQVDGMALEIGITPVKTLEGFNVNLDKVLNQIRKMVPDGELVFEPVNEFGAAYIKAQPLEAKQLGCEPDYNAYTGQANPVPNVKAPFRTASGHIHISWKKNDPNWPTEIDPMEASHFEACKMLTKTLDAFLGIPSIAWDKDNKRRQLYGQPGAFRPKCYGNGWLGLEYRVLSNKWLNYRQAIDLVYSNSIDAFTKLLKDHELPDRKYFGKTAKQILDGIEIQENISLAANIMKNEGTFKDPAYYREKREKGV